MERCDTCNGHGEVPMHYPDARGHWSVNWERCRSCDGAGEVPVATPIELDGRAVWAPGFTTLQFKRALRRALDDGLTVRIAGAVETFVVSSASAHGAWYLTTRATCTCPAGENDVPCKHRAIVCYTIDVLHILPESA